MRSFSIAVALLADDDPFIREAGMLSYTSAVLKQTLVDSPRGFRGSGLARIVSISSDGPFSSPVLSPYHRAEPNSLYFMEALVCRHLPSISLDSLR